MPKIGGCCRAPEVILQCSPVFEKIKADAQHLLDCQKGHIGHGPDLSYISLVYEYLKKINAIRKAIEKEGEGEGEGKKSHDENDSLQRIEMLFNSQKIIFNICIRHAEKVSEKKMDYSYSHLQNDDATEIIGLFERQREILLEQYESAGKLTNSEEGQLLLQNSKKLDMELCDQGILALKLVSDYGNCTPEERRTGQNFWKRIFLSFIDGIQNYHDDHGKLMITNGDEQRRPCWFKMPDSSFNNSSFQLREVLRSFDEQYHHTIEYFVNKREKPGLSYSI